MKLKTLRIGLVLAAVMLLLCLSAFAFGGNGSGTISDPYQIKTADHLKEIANDLDAAYKITSNIMLNDPGVFEYDENGVIIGVKEGAEVYEWTPIENFEGTINGGATATTYITGLYIPESKAVEGCSGMFANADGAKFNNVKIDFSLVEATEYAGILVGKAKNCTFSFNMIDGSVIGKTTQVQNTAGGIAGYFGEGCTMDKSVSYATVSGANSYSSNIGGLVGYNAGEITNSASDAKVAGTAMYYDAAVGGIAGSNAGIINNCTSKATVKGETTSKINDVYVGGIAGINNGTITQVKNTGAISVEKVAFSSDSIAAAGGVVGMMVDVDMDNVSNEGTVSGEYSYNGGIVGIAISTDGKHTIKNAKNTGAVNTTYGINGGIAGRAVAGGEGYVSTIMHFENCEASSESLYGEKGTVESAKVTGEIGAANITAPTTRIVLPIVAEANQFVEVGGTPVATFNNSSSGKATVPTADGRVVIRFRSTVGNNSTSADTPLTAKPVLVTVTEVTDLDAMEILSVDKSALTLDGGALNGTVVVKVYNPDLTNATAILGTSVDTQFVSAKFGNLDRTNKLTTLEINFNNVSALGATGDVAVNAMVVDSTDNMAPLCENKGA